MTLNNSGLATATTSNHTSSWRRLRRLLYVLLGVALLWVATVAIRWVLPASPLDLAKAAVEQGRFDDAIGQYRLYLHRRPNDWDARSALALVLAESDPAAALTELRRVPPDADVYVDAQRQIVSICLTQQRFREAEEVLLELEQLLPDDFLTQFTLAEVYFTSQRPKLALPHAQRSLWLQPDDPEALFLLAELLDDLNRVGEMVAPLERVVTLQADNYPAHLNLAYAYVESGQPAPGQREAEWCLARNPEDLHARRLLARAARDQGRGDEAMLEVERILELAADDFETRLLEGELLLSRQQAEMAWQRLRPLADRHHDERRLAALLARAAAATGRTAEAAEFRRQIQKLSE